MPISGAERAEKETSHETDLDIEAVLGRFHRWTTSRGGESMPKGVRELTYEEALASSRSRWSQHVQQEIPAPIAHESAGKSENQSHPHPDPSSLRAEPGVVPVAAPEPVTAKPARPKSETLNPSHASSEPASSAFREVMAETVRETARPRGTVLPKEKPASGARTTHAALDRQVSVTVRMTASEQALIRLRAAAAGISAPAYLRQCAIEVEVLRTQVEQLMTAATRARLAELTAPTPPPVFREGLREGWFSRWRRALNPTRSGQLSLRA